MDKTCANETLIKWFVPLCNKFCLFRHDNDIYSPTNSWNSADRPKPPQTESAAVDFERSLWIPSLLDGRRRRKYSFIFIPMKISKNFKKNKISTSAHLKKWIVGYFYYSYGPLIILWLFVYWPKIGIDSDVMADELRSELNAFFLQQTDSKLRIYVSTMALVEQLCMGFITQRRLLLRTVEPQPQLPNCMANKQRKKRRDDNSDERPKVALKRVKREILEIDWPVSKQINT